jgi:hypothetical protein
VYYATTRTNQANYLVTSLNRCSASLKLMTFQIASRYYKYVSHNPKKKQRKRHTSALTFWYCEKKCSICNSTGRMDKSTVPVSRKPTDWQCQWRSRLMIIRTYMFPDINADNRRMSYEKKMSEVMVSNLRATYTVKDLGWRW